MSAIATHPGTVTASTEGLVRVKIETVSACSSCQAHSRCGFAEKKEQEMDISSKEWKDYHTGDSVQVVIRESRGLLAVLLAYIIPSVLLIAGIFTFAHLFNELIAVVGVLALLALYYLTLYAFRSRLQTKFTFEIYKS